MICIGIFNCLRLWRVYKYAIVWTARLCLKLSHRPNYKHECRSYQATNMQKQRLLYKTITSTIFSQKNKDKSNEVTWGFLNIISGWCSIRFTPAFSTPAIYSCFFHSCIFHRCRLLLHFLLLHFPPLQFFPYRIFYSRIFSRPFLHDHVRDSQHSVGLHTQQSNTQCCLKAPLCSRYQIDSDWAKCRAPTSRKRLGRLMLFHSPIMKPTTYKLL